MITKELQTTSPKAALLSQETISIGTDSHPQYAVPFQRNRLYRAIFFVFGVLFAFLGTIIMFKSTNWACSLYFTNCEFVKQFAYSFCFLLSLGSILLSITIKPGHAAADELTGHYKKNLDRFYQDLKNIHPRQSTFKHFYYDTLDKIEEKKKETEKRLEWIKQASTLNYRSKQELSDKTLSDFQSKLKRVLGHFHSNTLSHLD